ncbi:MAG TPA: FAD-dependent oxidoreductase [Asanoa sp.]
MCGIPYHVSGEVPDRRQLAHRTTADLESAGLRLRLSHRATRIDPSTRTVDVVAPDGTQPILEYDRLVVGTGAVPAMPPIDGLDRLGAVHGVHVLHTMTDALALLRSIRECAPTCRTCSPPETALHLPPAPRRPCLPGVRRRPAWREVATTRSADLGC